ncbi:amphi-Trp domain-containing protein [Ectothiorhodospiraceae bacterium BW-2]|nr:amphi-Trp domain-containing protein [Ectothiorhodospiraceae bacterium BW-2]
MKRSKSSTFRHQSLQDSDSIATILSALQEGFAKGKLVLSDESGEIKLTPSGLLNVKLSADEEEHRHKLTLRISWQSPSQLPAKKGSLKVE